MELSDIQQIMHDFENSTTRELKIDDGDFHLYLNKNETNGQVPSTDQQDGGGPKAATNDQAAKPEEQEQTITAPLVGTVYLQPKPDAKPYVSVGDHVEKGDTVCVIEAMKMMTEIRSEYSGTVTGVKVENQELVEVEQPLFTVKEDQ